MMQICNACRYCEGFCAVFPAMTRRLQFSRGRRALPGQPVPQLRRLPARLPVRAAARVCRQRAAAMAQVRVRPMPTMPGPRRWAPVPAQRPDPGTGAGRRLALFLILAAGIEWLACGATVPAGDFYAVPARHCWCRCLHRSSCLRCWRWRWACALLARYPGHGAPASGTGGGRAAHNVLRLKYLDGGHGEGCNNADDAFTLAPALPPHHLSTASCCALRPPAWPRCTTMSWAGRRPTIWPACPSCWACRAA
jgi:citrate/tricarballylate utilization protein